MRSFHASRQAAHVRSRDEIGREIESRMKRGSGEGKKKGVRRKEMKRLVECASQSWRMAPTNIVHAALLLAFAEQWSVYSLANRALSTNIITPHYLILKKVKEKGT